VRAVKTPTLPYPLQRLYSTWEDYPDTILTEEGSMAGNPSATSATSSAKRRSGPLKFYAVKAGRVPGVYQNWEDVRQQTEGFNNHEGA
jgi:ribonuclease HI